MCMYTSRCHFNKLQFYSNNYYGKVTNLIPLFRVLNRRSLLISSKWVHTFLVDNKYHSYALMLFPRILPLSIGAFKPPRAFYLRQVSMCVGSFFTSFAIFLETTSCFKVIPMCRLCGPLCASIACSFVTFVLFSATHTHSPLCCRILALVGCWNLRN